MRGKYLKNRFAVGSLVMARLEGWPPWPAMVDDDPDTGDFFWTGVKGGEWEDKLSQYHVVFFDEKVVSRAWVLDRRVERMVEGQEKRSSNKRLCQAMEVARKAGREDLETRRRKYCLAARFDGPWGDVWPGWGEEESEDEQIEEESQDVPRLWSQSGGEQSPSIVEAVTEIVSSRGGQKKTPDTDVQLVNFINPIQDNSVVTSTAHLSMQVTPSLQSLLPPPSPVTSHSLTPFQTSTPVRKSAISSPTTPLTAHNLSPPSPPPTLSSPPLSSQQPSTPPVAAQPSVQMDPSWNSEDGIVSVFPHWRYPHPQEQQCVFSFV